MRNDINELFTDIDDDLIAGAMPEAQRPVEMKADTRRFSWKAFAAAAACLAVVMTGGAFALKAVSGRGGLVSSENANSDDLNPGGSTVSEPAGAAYPMEAKYQYTGDFSELELYEYALVDREAYWSFDKLVDNSDLIVLGTFVDDARQDCPTENWTYDPSYGASYNKLRVDKVFYGDVEVGDEIVIRDDTFVTDGKMMYIESSTLTPMIKGEQWVYFLKQQSPEYGYYYQPLFTEGRYPVPGNEKTFVLTGSQHGVFDERYFHEDMYEDVKKMLGYVDGVEIIERGAMEAKEFTMPEFPGVKFTLKENKLMADTGDGIYHGGAVIVRVYLADLNGDGKRELISLCREDGIGFISVFDYGTQRIRRAVQPEEKTNYDLEIRDDRLYLVTKNIDDGKEISAEPLTYDIMNSTGGSEIIKVERFDQERMNFKMREFPEDQFILKEKELLVSHDDGVTEEVLYTTPGIISLYLYDLNGDGKRELVNLCWNGASGLSADQLMVYDYANSKCYTLKTDTTRLITNDLEIRDNVLYVLTYPIHDDSKAISDEPLTFDMLTPITRCGLDDLDGGN